MDIRTAFEFHPLYNNLRSEPKPASPNKNNPSTVEKFQKLLADQSYGTIPPDKSGMSKIVIPPLNESFLPTYTIAPTPPNQTQSLTEQIRIYKNDQLLAHPGGDCMDLKADDPRMEQTNHRSFLENIVKDIKDALANTGNFFKDLLWGSEYRYVDDKGQVQTAQRKGFLENAVSFFKDAVSGLSLGHYRQNGDPEPNGIVERSQFVCKKLINDALINDMIFGMPSSAINLLDDGALALWNLLEVVPDATIGTIPAARRVVTTVFDNGQVMIDYISDCLPTSEAWMRVHAYQFNNGRVTSPFFFNLTLPERYSEDSRWSTVRNTPLRKSIETIGSMLADIGIATATYHAIRTSKKRD